MTEEKENNFLLEGYRVLDLTDEKGLLCAKILADLGTDVIKIEKPGGAPRSEEKMREREVRLKANIEAIERDDIQAFVQHRISAAFSPDFTERNPDTAEQYSQILLQTDLSGHLRVLRGLLRPPSPADLSRIRCSTLIIEGEYDSYSDLTAAKAAQQAIAGSQLEVFPTGHATALEQPEAYNQTVLQFLSKPA